MLAYPGYVGTFTLTIPWQNITGKPVEVFIEDVYLLAVPAAENAVRLCSFLTYARVH